jgi:hypothetical protein
METNGLAIGQRISWLSTPFLGFGSTFSVPGVIIGMTATRVQIEVKKNDGKVERHWVKPERLTVRNSRWL